MLLISRKKSGTLPHMNRDSLYVQFADLLKQLIFEERYPVGSTFPSISKLESVYGYSRKTIVSAVNILKSEHIIERQGATRQGYTIISDCREFQKDLRPLNDSSDILLILPFSYWNYVGSKLLEAMETVFTQNGSNLILRNHKNNVDFEEAIIKNLLATGCEGLKGVVLVTSDSYSNRHVAIIKELQNNLPLILLDRKIDGIDSNYIGIDNYGIGQKQAEHLYSKGHRTIGFFSGFCRISTMVDRLKGFKDTLEKLGHPVAEEHITLEGSLYENLELIDRAPTLLHKRLDLTKYGPTAYACGSDKDALALLTILRERNIRVPEDIAIIGCDYDEFAASKGNIVFTSFKYPYMELSKETYNLFQDYSAHQEGPFKRIEISAEFVDGETS